MVRPTEGALLAPGALRAAALLCAAVAPLACTYSRAVQPGVESVDNAYAPARAPESIDPSWTVDVAYEGLERINGVACADLDPAVPGDEIVSVDAAGVVRLMELRGGHFFENAAIRRAIDAGGDRSSGELVQVAAGDLDRSAAGDEVLAVGALRGAEDDGGPGALRYFARDSGGGWSRRTVTLDALAHAVAVGDLVPERPGNEFVVAGFFGEALIGHVEGEERSPVLKRVGARHPGNAKSVALVDGGFVLACDDGNTVTYRRASDGTWERTRVVQHGAPLARIARLGRDGFVVCDNGGALRRVDGGTSRERTLLVQRDDRMRGAVVADLDPRTPGDEVATAGYDGAITVVRPDGSGARDVARDTNKLHHLAVGSFDGIGVALVAAGYAGDVLVVAPR
ncbi:MAG: hypothetical protein AAFP22_10690, partial [Planctomycetota bacterium]